MCIKLPWVPEDIFFLSILMVRGEAASTKREAPREASRELYQTLSTVYFILGILERTSGARVAWS